MAVVVFPTPPFWFAMAIIRCKEAPKRFPFSNRSYAKIQILNGEPGRARLPPSLMAHGLGWPEGSPSQFFFTRRGAMKLLFHVKQCCQILRLLLERFHAEPPALGHVLWPIN